MKHHPFTKLASILVVCLMTFSSAAFASDAELMALVKNMQKQMNELQTTVMAQKTEIEALKAGGGGKIRMAQGGVEAAPPMSEDEFKQRLIEGLHPVGGPLRYGARDETGLLFVDDAVPDERG